MSVITFDDRDPIIHYSSGWNAGGNAGDVDGTSTFTTANGSTASITFTGVQISVFGTVPFVLPKTTSAYSIDGGPPTLFTSSFQPQGAGTPNTYFFQQPYYQSPQLSPNTPHTLVITNAGGVPTQFFLDFIKVVAASPDPTSSTSTTTTLAAVTTPTQRPTTDPGTTSPTSSVTSTSASTKPTSLTSIPNNSPSTAPTSSTTGTSSSPLAAAAATTAADATISPTVDKSSSPPIGLIVGSVIGGLAVILLGIGIYLLWRQMRRKNRPLSEAPTLHPFPTPTEFEDSQPDTAAFSVINSSGSRTEKSQDLTMAQSDYTSVSDPRQSRHTLLEHPPPQYQR